MGQKPSKSVYDHKSDNASKCLISQHLSIIIKTGKILGRVAHNLKVIGSNPIPATNHFKHLAALQGGFVFSGAALVPHFLAFRVSLPEHQNEAFTLISIREPWPTRHLRPLCTHRLDSRA